MPTDTFSWLHLTDFHYGLKGQGCLWPNLREPFLDSLAALHERCGPWDAVFFTGDLVQSGESAQFNELQTEVLDPLWQKLGELGSGNAVLLAVPGNHDLYRPDPRDDDPAAERLLEPDGFERIKDKFWDQPGGSYRRVIGNVFAAYREWWEKAPHRPGKLQTGALPGDFSAILERNERRIGIVGLNVTFLQLTGDDYKGRLVWDVRQLHAVCDGGADIWSKQHDVCLLLTHQGPDWLTPEARKHGELEIAPAGRFAAHLFGHQHETEITYLRKGGGSKPVLWCQGCSVFGMEKFGAPPVTQRAHGYAAGRIEFDGQETVLRLWPRIATNKTGRWRFVPDHDHAELESDEGTRAEPIAARPRAANVPPVLTTPATTPVSNPPTPSAFVPHSTLPVRRPFFGRVKDLEQIAKYLLPEDRSWGVVLDGPGGIGKTALALEAAHRAPVEHFPLKLWVTAKNRELHPDGERRLRDHCVADYYALLAELGQALGRDGISSAAPEERPNLVRHALANHRALLVLDNLETFNTEERRRVFELLGTLPVTCRALVTSRRRVGGSFAAHALRLDKLERAAADELLAELGQRWPPIARLTPAERNQLYAETGGNPLLLTWAAGQLGRTTGRCRTVAEAVGRLQEAHRLEALNKEKNDPLDFVFGDLAETFTADETAVLAALVHFTQPTPIAWLLPLTKLSEKAAETALDGLRDRALLVEDDIAGTWLLPPLAAHFLRRVRPEAVGASGERLAEQAYALAVENGYQEYDCFPILEAAWPRLAAALPLLLAGGDNTRLQRVCAALFDFLYFTGRWDDLLALHTEAETKAEWAKDFFSAGGRAYDAGWIHYLRGQAAEVLACAERAAIHWQAVLAGTDERALVLRLRGFGYTLAKDYPAALAAHRNALALRRSQLLRGREMRVCLSDVVGTLCKLGQIDEAETHCREVLAMTKTLSDPDGVACFTGHLAELALAREQWPEAERLAREALKLGEALGYKEVIAASCRRLAKALARQGRSAEGRCHAEQAVAISAALRSRKLAEAQAVLAECQA